jgi:hypothetical protein
MISEGELQRETSNVPAAARLSIYGLTSLSRAASYLPLSTFKYYFIKDYITILLFVKCFFISFFALRLRI